jgi:hypothetical protein
MSFDVFLQRFEHGDSAEVGRRAVLQVLKGATYRGPDQFGFYVVSLPEGGDVEFSASGLESQDSFNGCAFHVRGFSDSLAKFIFDIARAGDMVIIPAMEGNPLILLSEAQRPHVHPDALKSLRPVVVNSAQELAALLGGGFGAWSRYRDQVLGA